MGVLDNLENPFIKVTWEDIPENFTQERIKRVRSYFQHKYNSKNVTVVTKAVDKTSGKELDLDLEQNIMDTGYQRSLMTQFVRTNDMDTDITLLKRLDDRVNAHIANTVDIDTKYKRVYIKNIKFSNFLSFGENNFIDIDKLNGITVIDSTPPNFGGKSVLAVDLILFLFFNTTTKTTKALEIFNRFKKSNEVVVQGEVEIDGRDYIIVRKIKRRKTKKDEWSVSTSLEFLERKKDGTLQNFTGEQRRETEKFIKESIGTMNDFLLTVLSTASNLESLIESKPTERGNILSRFIGLEVLKDKEIACKEMYSKWSKTIISNVYNVEELKQEINKLTLETTNLEKSNKNEEITLNKIINELSTKNKNRDELISQRNTDIDVEIQKTNPRLLEETISEEDNKLKVLENKLKAYGDSDKPETINLELLKNKKTKKDDLIIEKTTNNVNLRNIDKTITELEEAEICPLCKRNLEEVDHTEEIKKLKKESKELNINISQNTATIETLGEEIDTLESKKLVFDEYEKEILKKERLILEIGQHNFELKRLNSKLKKWKDNKEKVEKNSKIEKKVLSINSEIDILTNTKDTLFREIESNINRIKTIDNLIGESNNKIEKIKKENEINKVFRSYLTIFGKNGIIKTIVKSVVPKLNNELVRLLSEVTNFMVEIRVNNKNEVEFWMVDNDSGVEKLLITGSGFEKTLASLAIRTVLTKVSCLPRPNITVFDEVLGKVSNENLDQVGTFFNRIKDYFENVFLITHNPLVREWADDTITIKKENNISKFN